MEPAYYYAHAMIIMSMIYFGALGILGFIFLFNTETDFKTCNKYISIGFISQIIGCFLLKVI